ncbi:hypothetical protein N7535_005929 [Penicillium sp. DV-2018c]|nr:hypothetical protein N7535_005929 [Penicillium sp. DV-2018c]
MYTIPFTVELVSEIAWSKPQFAPGEVRRRRSLALANAALFGIESVADLAQGGLLRPPYDGPQGIPLTQGRFTSYMHQIFAAAGYTEHSTIHCFKFAL